MADKIDNINGYDIDLPPDATPSIASLTAGSVSVQAGSGTNVGSCLIAVNTSGVDAEASITFSNFGIVGYTSLDSTGITLSAPLTGTYKLSYPSLTANAIIATQSWVEGKGYTTNQGTVTSVGAGTGLSISGTASVNPTVNIASGYKLPTTTEWNSKSSVSGANDGTNWTSITIDGTTKNIPSGGSGSGITEISTQYVRIWDLEPGIYLLTYAGTKYIYYSGASGTSTHTVIGGAAKIILTVEGYSSTTKFWYYDSVNAVSGLANVTRYYGRTTSSSGSNDSVPLTPYYQHSVLFTVGGYGVCKYEYIDRKSSSVTELGLIEMLVGKVLTDLSSTTGEAFFVFGSTYGERLEKYINFARYWNNSGNASVYVSGASITISSQTSTKL